MVLEPVGVEATAAATGAEVKVKGFICFDGPVVADDVGGGRRFHAIGLVEKVVR